MVLLPRTPRGGGEKWRFLSADRLTLCPCRSHGEGGLGRGAVQRPSLVLPEAQGGPDSLCWLEDGGAHEKEYGGSMSRGWPLADSQQGNWDLSPAATRK